MWCPCSGGRAVGGFRDPGQFVEWTVSVPKAGNYKLTWRYGAGGTSTNRELRVNGKTVNASLSFPSTNTWSNWQTFSVTVALTAGTNHVRLNSNTWVSADYLNLDYLEVG
jgi:rhamnogalacturonan endolyase